MTCQDNFPVITFLTFPVISFCFAIDISSVILFFFILFFEWLML